MKSNFAPFPEPLLRAWGAGAEEFNSGRFWHAHECWEQGWVSLPEPEKTYIQALIQVAAVIHLLGRERIRPALALCVLALAKFHRVRGCPGRQLPPLQVLGAETFLQSVLDQGGQEWKGSASLLKAVLKAVIVS